MTSTPPPEPAVDAQAHFGRLLVIDDREPRSGPVNMALDELLLNETRDGVPLLRFYRWESPTVSFGYFEPVDAARRLAGSRPVVRRMTGGGLVEHGDDLTYTLLVGRPEPFASLRAADSYRLIHAALGLALTRLGLSTTLQAITDDQSGRWDDNACFRRPVLHDLIAGGRKIAGGAQRRTRAGLMHQGSLHLPASSGSDWWESVRHALPKVLARQCDERSLKTGETLRAGELAATKYANARWTNRR